MTDHSPACGMCERLVVARLTSSPKGHSSLRFALQKILSENDSLGYCGLQSRSVRQRLFTRSFGGFSRGRRHVLLCIALVRVELLLNSRLPELTRVRRKLRIAGFTNTQGWNAANTFYCPKSMLCHDPSLSQSPETAAASSFWAGRPGAPYLFHCHQLIKRCSQQEIFIDRAVVG